MSISGTIENLIEGANFKDTVDFMRSRKTAVVDIGDIRDLLEIYDRELRGEVRRKKFEKKKVQKVEHSLTPSGVKKLNDARKSLRMHVEASRKKSQRSEKVPPIQKEDLTEYYGFDEGPEDFIHKMHEWGNFPVDDRRYYLHMVFRYYFKEYHDHAVNARAVIPHPSYQYILDNMFPNECANRFPPEFRRFLVDSAGRQVTTVSLPVPLKGSASKVTYDYNFESNPHVSTLRRKIESIIIHWKSCSYNVYPHYLCVGNPKTELVIQRDCYARKIILVKEGLKRLVNVDIGQMDSVGEKFPAALTAYDEYMLHQFRTPGEQLNERMGFFMMSKYRQIFFELDSLVENLFVVSGAGMEVLVAFQMFCTQNGKGFGKVSDENLCRSLLMVIVDVCFFFHVVENRRLADEDPVQVLTDVVDSCGSSPKK